MLGKPMLGTYGQHLVAPHGALRVCNDQKRQLEDDLRAVSGVGSVPAPGPPPRRTCRAHPTDDWNCATRCRFIPTSADRPRSWRDCENRSVILERKSESCWIFLPGRHLLTATC